MLCLLFCTCFACSAQKPKLLRLTAAIRRVIASVIPVLDAPFETVCLVFKELYSAFSGFIKILLFVFK